MRRVIPALLLSLATLAALAQTVQFDGGSVGVGDSLDQLLKVAGRPERVLPFPGMPQFQRYEYSTRTRNITVTVKDGKVTGLGVLDFTSK